MRLLLDSNVSFYKVPCGTQALFFDMFLDAVNNSQTHYFDTYLNFMIDARVRPTEDISSGLKTLFIKTFLHRGEKKWVPMLFRLRLK